MGEVAGGLAAAGCRKQEKHLLRSNPQTGPRIIILRAPKGFWQRKAALPTEQGVQTSNAFQVCPTLQRAPLSNILRPTCLTP